MFVQGNTVKLSRHSRKVVLAFTQDKLDMSETEKKQRIIRRVEKKKKPNSRNENKIKEQNKGSFGERSIHRILVTDYLGKEAEEKLK